MSTTTEATATVELTRDEVLALMDTLVWADQKSGGRRTYGPVKSAWRKMSDALGELPVPPGPCTYVESLSEPGGWHGVLDRAVKLYLDTADATSPDQPAGDSSILMFDCNRYAVLRNINGVLAVYRDDADGLSRLEEWPAELGLESAR